MKGLLNSLVRVLIALAITAGFFFSLPASADEGRRVRNKVNPIYPEMARKVNATGAVRLEVQITPSGEVRSVKVLGGHPLLIPAAEDAIRKWKFEPASETTTTVVEFRFSPTT